MVALVSYRRLIFPTDNSIGGQNMSTRMVIAIFWPPYIAIYWLVVKCNWLNANDSLYCNLSNTDSLSTVNQFATNIAFNNIFLISDYVH